MRQLLCKQSSAPEQATVKFWYLSGQEGLFKRAAVAITGTEGGEALLCSFCRLLLLLSKLDLFELAAFSGKTACAPRELTPEPQVPFSPRSSYNSHLPCADITHCPCSGGPVVAHRHVGSPRAGGRARPIATYRAEVPP